MVEVIAAVRKFKAEKGLSLKEDIKEITIEYENKDSLKPFIDDLKATTHALEIKFDKAEQIISENLKISILQ